MAVGVARAVVAVRGERAAPLPVSHGRVRGEPQLHVLATYQQEHLACLLQRQDELETNEAKLSESAKAALTAQKDKFAQVRTRLDRPL